MDSIKRIDATTVSLVSLQLKALFVYEFLKEYNELELTIRNIFEKNLSSLSLDVIQQLYFYYGGKIGSYIEYETHSTKLNTLSYKSKENFKGLSINQIIKIFQKDPKITPFNFSINSIQYSFQAYSFYDCITRLLNMRNKLAHEVVNYKFNNDDLIEMLTREQIAKKPFKALQNYDIQKTDDMTMYIASNIIYMQCILEKLNETAEFSTQL